jgi:Bacteroides conjugative transposon TraN protein
MKQTILKSSFIIICLTTIGNLLFAQHNMQEKIAAVAVNNQYTLNIGTSKTTVLIFPARIITGGVDIGSSAVIAKTMTGVDNILRVKAATKNFSPTNITVITTDGKVYSFLTAYSDDPDDRPIDMGKQQQEEKKQAALHDRQLNDGQVKDVCQSILTTKPFLVNPKTKSFRVKLSLQGLYAKEDVLFFRLKLANKSPLDYATDFSRFYIRDKKRVKRTAVQESELQPLCIYMEHENNTPGKTKQSIVVAFKRFTIADHKQLTIQLFEKNGDRHLELKVSGNQLMKTEKL